MSQGANTVAETQGTTNSGLIDTTGYGQEFLAQKIQVTQAMIQEEFDGQRDQLNLVKALRDDLGKISSADPSLFTKAKLEESGNQELAEAIEHCRLQGISIPDFEDQQTPANRQRIIKDNIKSMTDHLHNMSQTDMLRYQRLTNQLGTDQEMLSNMERRDNDLKKTILQNMRA